MLLSTDTVHCTLLYAYVVPQRSRTFSRKSAMQPATFSSLLFTVGLVRKNCAGVRGRYDRLRWLSALVLLYVPFSCTRSRRLYSTVCHRRTSSGPLCRRSERWLPSVSSGCDSVRYQSAYILTNIMGEGWTEKVQLAKTMKRRSHLLLEFYSWILRGAPCSLLGTKSCHSIDFRKDRPSRPPQLLSS